MAGSYVAAVGGKAPSKSLGLAKVAGGGGRTHAPLRRALGAAVVWVAPRRGSAATDESPIAGFMSAHSPNPRLLEVA